MDVFANRCMRFTITEDREVITYAYFLNNTRVQFLHYSYKYGQSVFLILSLPLLAY